MGGASAFLQGLNSLLEHTASSPDCFLQSPPVQAPSAERRGEKMAMPKVREQEESAGWEDTSARVGREDASVRSWERTQVRGRNQRRQRITWGRSSDAEVGERSGEEAPRCLSRQLRQRSRKQVLVLWMRIYELIMP
ncbi:hypothetical protein XENTR_v10007896 [Xenopus tropicalis]|nr:hypothetical protein XENTR_v10007896 [Xenopus tropicalis]